MVEMGFWRQTRRKKVERKTTRKQKHFPPPGPNQCHPRVGTVRPAHGCLPPAILKRVGGKLNVDTQDPTALRKQLETKLNVSSGQEHSFLSACPLTDSEKEYLRKTYLRPVQPSKWKEDPDMWLDSTNIEAVMKQYEEAYPEFEFMGPFPIDFAAPDPYTTGPQKKCLIREMCGLRILEAQKKGTKYIGIVYNLDPHFKGGSHWVANFIDIPKKKCYYFDSYGYEPPKQIATFMKWLHREVPDMKLFFNARRFQMQGSECGMYSLYFIIRMLMGDSFRPFCRKQPRDFVMLDYRDWIFST
jgi:hypothetical protein